MKTIDGNATLERGGVKALLEEMDRNGVERMVIGPARNFAAVENRAGNSYIAAAVRRHPDRFIGFAVASPWYGKKAAAALNRCPNLWIETSYILPSQITAWVETCGVAKFVFGSDHPFSSLPLELKKISLLKDSIDKGAILGGNLPRFLGRPR